MGGQIFNETLNKTIGGSYVRFIITLEGTTNDTITTIGEEFQWAYENYWELHSSDHLQSNCLIIATLL